MPTAPNSRWKTSREAVSSGRPKAGRGQAGAQEDGDGTGDGDPPGAGYVAQQAQPHGAHPERDHRQAADEAPAERPLRHGDDVAEDLDRRRTPGPPRRDRGGQHGDDDTDDVGGDHGAGCEDDGLAGDVQAEGGEHRLQQLGQPQPEHQPDGRAQEPDDDRLDDHRHEHLARGGTQRAEQGQLPAPLGHEDGEGVDDEKGTDEQRDPGEDEQERPEEGQHLAQGRRRVVGDLLTGQRHHGVGQRLGHRVAQLLLADPGLGGDPHVVELVVAAEEQLLRGRRVEDGERGSRERATVGEVEDRDQGGVDLVLAAGGHDADLVTDLVAGLLRRTLVESHLAGHLRGAAVDDLADLLATLTWGVVPAEAEPGRAHAAHDLAVRADDEDALGTHVAVGPSGSRHLRQLVDEGRRDGLVRGRAVLGDAVDVPDDDVAGGSLEDLREAGGQHVGEDQRAHDEPHTEHDRGGAQQESQLPVEQALQGRLEHQ